MKIITRQHSGGAMLAVAYVTRQYKWHSIGGDIRYPPALCLCKINNPFFKVAKTLSNKKVLNYKVPYFHNLLIYTIFIRVAASFEKVVVILFTKCISLICSFKKLCERCIRFVKNLATTIPDEQMTKIKVVHLQKL
jgi:hypothetical protein